MKLALLLTTAFLATTLAAAPTASADTCAMGDDLQALEPGVCGAYFFVKHCVLDNAFPKPNLAAFAACDVVILS